MKSDPDVLFLCCFQVAKKIVWSQKYETSSPEEMKSRWTIFFWLNLFMTQKGELEPPSGRRIQSLVATDLYKNIYTVPCCIICIHRLRELNVIQIVSNSTFIQAKVCSYQKSYSYSHRWVLAESQSTSTNFHLQDLFLMCGSDSWFQVTVEKLWVFTDQFQDVLLSLWDLISRAHTGTNTHLWRISGKTG